MRIGGVVVFENGKFDKAFLDITYLVLFSLVTFHKILQTTMFAIGYPIGIRMLLRVLLVFCFGIKIWSGYRLSRYEAFFLMLLAGTAFLVWYNTGYMEVIDVTLLIAGASGIRFDKILKTYLVVAIPCIVVTVAASRLGLVENLVYHRGDIPRAAFGFVYPTDFVAHIFYVVIIWCALKNVLLRCWEYAVFVLLAVCGYVFCNARMNVLCIMMAVLLFLGIKWWDKCEGVCVNKARIEQVVGRVLVWGTALCAGVITLMTWFYNSDNSIWKKINDIVTYRLEFGKLGLDRYGISLFGQKIPIVGMGGTLEYSKDYFFLDSSYVRILLEYGVLLFVIVVVMFTISAYKLYKQKQYYLLVALNLMAIQCIIEHHMLEIAYNPFLFMVLADITFAKSQKILDNKESRRFS